MTNYKATPKQWEQVLSWSEDCDVSVSCDAACILELRARVEALEDKNRPGFMELSVTTTTAPVCRPKPPSLKEQALEGLAWIDEHLDMPLHNHCTAIHTIRRALEQLPDE
jgi:hypothetical protein